MADCCLLWARGKRYSNVRLMATLSPTVHPFQSMRTVTVDDTRHFPPGRKTNAVDTSPRMDGDLENNSLPYRKPVEADRKWPHAECGRHYLRIQIRCNLKVCGWYADCAIRKLRTRTDCGSKLYRLTSVASVSLSTLMVI